MVHAKSLMAEWNFFTIESPGVTPPDTINAEFFAMAPLFLWWVVPSLVIAYSAVKNHLTDGKAAVDALYRTVSTWELINLIVISELYYSFPTKDFRFLYGTLFILGMIVYKEVAIRAKPAHIALLTTGVCVFTVCSVVLFQPAISKQTYALARVRQLALTYHPNSIAYFFEDDSPTYNMLNIRAMHAELSLFRFRGASPFEYANLWGDGMLKKCHTSVTSEYLVIFTSMRQSPNHVHFASVCPPSFTAQYKPISTETFSDGTVQLLRKASRK
jgi:hypothetical protein